MSNVKAISMSQQSCGKRLADSKKKIQWKFMIQNDQYTLELINSALSGKKTIYLNQTEIYNEKDVLNLNFDFSYNVQGHLIRITKAGKTSVHLFELRIDNRSFDDYLNNTGNYQEPTIRKHQKDSSSNPFQSFQQATKSCQGKTSTNQFGDFDFDNSYENNHKITMNNVCHSEGQISMAAFQTNFLQKNSQIDSKLKSFMDKFAQNQKQILQNSEDIFSTNNIAYVNKYRELQQANKHQQQNEQQKEKQKQSSSFFMQKIDKIKSLKPQMNKKKMMLNMFDFSQNMKSKYQGQQRRE